MEGLKRRTIRFPGSPLLLVSIWVLVVHIVSLRIWFDWETVRFFVQPRPGRFGILRPLTGNWIDLSDYGISVASQTWRPLMSWLFQLEVLIFDRKAWGYHLINLSVHLLCVVLLYHLGRRWNISRGGAAAAALLFGVHPLVTQPLWILGDCAEQFVLLGGLAALLWYRDRSGLAAAGFLVALSSKETAVTIPLWLAAADMLWPGTRGDHGAVCGDFRTRFRRLLPFFIIVFMYLLYRTLIFHGMGGYRSVDHMRLNHLPDVIMQNTAWLLTVPHGSGWMWIPVVIFGMTFLLMRRVPVISWSVIWLSLFLLPVHNLCNKWYLYTPVAAVALWIGGLSDRLICRTGWTRVIPGVVLSLAVWLSLASGAELRHQARNAGLAPELAVRVKAILPETPAATRFIFRLPAEIQPTGLKGHWFNPAVFRIKARKTPVESIVWDLNGVRYKHDGTPVWSRSVEAALRLSYDDITLTARLVPAGEVITKTGNVSCTRSFLYMPPPEFKVVPE